MGSSRPTPLQRQAGYLPLEDHGLIGDGHTAALVARDGSIPWLCVPRFDAQPLLCGLLDHRRGGSFSVRLAALRAARQRYEPDTAVLVTEQWGADGAIRITDAMGVHHDADLSEPSRSASAELVREVEVLEGDPVVEVALSTRHGARTEPTAGGLRLRWSADPDLPLRLLATRPLEGLRTRHRLERGERLGVLLSWREEECCTAGDAHAILERTRHAWRTWIGEVHYAGPCEAEVRRSAITLKLLDYHPNGAIIAAPTSSLPEAIGAERNWDYRYTWIRDAAFTVHALRRLAMQREADDFLRWVIDTVERSDRPAVLYDVDGHLPADEELDAELEGYRASGPVRWGNAAAAQQQFDVYGEVLDCAFQWVERGGELGEVAWEHLTSFVEQAIGSWETSDHGIWEVRGHGDPFTYTSALCQVAADRGARIARALDLPADVRTWERAAEEIRRGLLDRAWNDDLGAITGCLGGCYLDASVLALPLRRVLPADDPRMVSTVRVVRERLGAGGGLLHRYRSHEVPDGFDSREGAFLLCSFWLVDNLANQGQLDEAVALYESLCDRGGALGLLPEEIDPSDGTFLGNYPQALSHVGLVSSGVVLGRRLAEREEGANPFPEGDHDAFHTATSTDPPYAVES